MIKILFICHGNICRSTMAEFVFKDLVKKAGIESRFYIESAATSREEIGNDIHPGTKQILRSKAIPFERHYARQITIDDYNDFDLLIGMDCHNLYNMKRILGEDTEGKMHLLSEYAGLKSDIADPWYTGDFNRTYQDVLAGCQGLLAQLRAEITT